MESYVIELSETTPFAWFAGVWWASVTFHVVVGLVFWLTKAGRWSELVGGFSSK